jgi:prepilin-type processing-associated H-X9-DG protein
VPVGLKSAEFWAKGYNTNYATSWHFSRGDPTAADGYGTNGDPTDPNKCPRDGDGPMNSKHLSTTPISADRIVIMGDARAGDGTEAAVDAAYAQTVNTFADETVLTAGEYTAESFTDGMNVDYGGVSGNAGEKGHEFNDIAPLHKPKSGDYVGGFANVLFADGHVSAVTDVAGVNGNKPDGFLGPYRTNGTNFEINQDAFKEIRKTMWYGRMRPKAGGGGGSDE